jgi:hypothetical protein
MMRRTGSPLAPIKPGTPKKKSSLKGGRRSREWMVVGFTITYAAISAYHH